MSSTEASPAGVGTPADGSPVVSVRRAPRLRTVLGLARVEAFLLFRSPLLAAGLLAGGLAIWLIVRLPEPLWWAADWEIGAGQLVLGMAAMVAAQLAAGRAWRNEMTHLYASFPAAASTRTLAHLASLAGAAPASLLLIGASAVVVQARGAIGTPNIMVLAAGLLLVIAAGAAGIATGTRFTHPLAGVLGAVVLFATAVTASHLAPGASTWLLPWEVSQDQLRSLPGPLAGYPPAGGHALELAGIAILAGIVALVVTARNAQARGILATAGILALAVIGLAGAVQLQPIPTADLNHLVNETADPGSVQQCTTASRVRYCLYPGFGRDLSSLEAPVNAVLERLPARPAQPLTVRQVVQLDLPDSTLTHGHPDQQVSQWDTRAQHAPGYSYPSASAIYLPVGSWPAGGDPLADAQFDVALSAADWAVNLPGPVSRPGSLDGQCVPVDQAREAIAIWLAMVGTHPLTADLQAGLHGLQTGSGFLAARVHNTQVLLWTYPDSSVSPPGGGPEDTATGYLLASAMTSLPQQKVSDVLTGGWGRWLNWRTTDAQLAAALGLRIPSYPALPSPQIPNLGHGKAAKLKLPRLMNPVCT